MKIEYRSAEHLDESDLARLLDDEADRDERLLWSGHLETCPECAQRLEELEDVAFWLHGHVVALDEGMEPTDIVRARALSALRAKAAPSSGRGIYRGHALRVAATIAVVLVGGFSVTPVRAWITDNVERLAGRFDQAPVLDLPAAPLAAEGALVTFSPTESTFRVELDSPQATGSITIELAETFQASAQVIGGTGETLAVMPTGLWIGNGAGSSASYRIRLPASFIRNVEITAEGNLLEARSVEGAPRTTVIDLARVAPPQ